MTPEPNLFANPYIGPRTFEREQGRLFFGREQEARDLLARAVSERLLLFYAQSGAGKSSLLNTRLIPGLQGEGFTVLPVGRVSGELPPGVAQVDNIYLFNLMLSLDQGAGDPGRLAHLPLSRFLAGLTTEDGAHWEYVPPAAQTKNAPAGQPFVLIIDQFEEIVTSHPGRWREREEFFRQLDGALRDDPNLWVVLTLREDYVAALDPYAHLMADRLRARFHMERMSVAAALDAIREPASLGGRSFAPGVAEKLVEDLRQVRVPGQEATVAGQYVEPVQLQVVCYQLWERLRRGTGGIEGTGGTGETEGTGGIEGTEITEADLAEAGDVDRALEQFYADTLAAVLADEQVVAAGVGERALRTWFDKELLTETGIRNTVFRNEASGRTGTIANAAVDGLARRFLLRTEVRGGGAWVELVHDRFVEPIRGSNRAWFAKNQNPLTQATLVWQEAGRDRQLLYDGRALTSALAELERSPELYGALERAFLEAGRKEEERRAARRRRWLAAGATALGIVLLALTVWALWSAKIANEARADADAQKRIVRAEELAAKAMILGQTDPQSGLLVAIEALNVQRSRGEPPRLAAEQSLRDLLGKTGGIPLFGHEKEVYAIAFSPDGQWLASASEDGTVRLWAVADPGAEPHILRGHEQPVRAIAFSPDSQWLASASFDSTVRLWAMANPGAAPRILRGHEQPVRAIAFSPDGQWLASASFDSTVRLWDMADPSVAPRILRGHEGWVWAVAFSPDSQWLASAGFDGTVRLWAVADPSIEPRILRGHENWVRVIAFSPDGQWLASAGMDRSVRLWAVADPSAEPRILRGHEKWIRAIAFSPDGQWLASASDEGAVRLWAVADPNAEPHLLRGHEGGVFAIAFSPDGQWLASASSDTTVRLWTVADPDAEPHILRGHEDWVLTIAFSPDGQWLASASSDGTVRLWAIAASYVEPRILRGHENWVRAIAFSPDGQWLASASDDSTVRLWAMADPNAEPHILRGHEEGVSAIAFSADGQWLASAGADSAARLWAVADPDAESHILRGHEEGVSAIAFSPDGQWLASADEYDGTVRLWSVADPDTAPRLLQGHEFMISAIAFSPDGQWLASASEEGTVRLWAVADPDAESRILDGYGVPMSAIAFSPDERWLVSAGSDGAVRLWAMADLDAAPLLLQQGFKNWVSALAFSPDGQWLASAGRDGTVRLWTVPLNAVIEHACRSAARNLSQARWQEFFKNEEYRRTCPQFAVHPSHIADLRDQAAKKAQAGDLNAALAGFQSALALEGKVITVTAQAYLDLGDVLARAGDLRGAATQYERSLALAPNPTLDPPARARRFAVQARLDEAQNSINTGSASQRQIAAVHAIVTATLAIDASPQTKAQVAKLYEQLAADVVSRDAPAGVQQGIGEATTLFTLARQFDPSLEYDPEHRANEIAAQALISSTSYGGNAIFVQQALTNHAEAERLNPKLQISAERWNQLCRQGALNDLAWEVLPACERAVVRVPNDGEIHDSRGLARALGGDIPGAIADFKFYVDWMKALGGSGGRITTREAWIAALEAGADPAEVFGEEMLEGLWGR